MKPDEWQVLRDLAEARYEPKDRAEDLRKLKAAWEKMSDEQRQELITRYEAPRRSPEEIEAEYEKAKELAKSLGLTH